MFARSERKLTKGSLREGAVTSVRVTEGERVTIEQIQIQSTVGSFHHSVVPLPLGGRLFVSLLLSWVVGDVDPYEYNCNSQQPVGAIRESPVIETMNLYPLFLLVREAQKKKLGKKKHAVKDRGLCAHTPPKGLFKKSPFGNRKTLAQQHKRSTGVLPILLLCQSSSTAITLSILATCVITAW